MASGGGWVAPLVRKAALACLPLLVLLGLCELGLRAAGLGDHAQDVSRGFDERARYLVADPGRPGGFRTRMFDDPSAEVVVPPRDGRVRVLLFGGSNTQLFPEGVLQDLLDGDPDAGLAPDERAGDARPGDLPARVEVINLGREGYGSERVSILVEQSVPLLAPDVVVIHSGHNEFIESAFADELRRRRAGAATDAERVLSGLRTFTVLRDLLAPSPSPEPEPMQRDPAQRPMTRAETSAHYARYRENLRRMLDVCEGAGARVVLCTLTGNMLSPPFVASGPDGPPADVLARVEKLRGRAQKLVPEALRAGMRPAVRLRTTRYYLARVVDPEPWTPPAPRVLGGILADVRATAGEGADSVAGAHWPDPRLWNSDVRAVEEGFARFWRREVDEALHADLQRALALLDEAAALAPDYAHTAFDRGLVLYLLGEDARAVESLRAAICADRTPRCANDLSNAVVRELAAADPRVELLDVDALVRASCPAGLVGYDVLMDVCHLQPGVRVALMRELARVIGARLPEETR
ncbi:MAG: hypothetical protein H6825_12720 [Planctomycetes bacterium]|nr:hypothetical protein [Planctomycetota bacterium]